MVRLKVRLPFVCRPSAVFQFQYGTIKSFLTLKKFQKQSCFNSNMVRLKERKHFNGTLKRKFQFQYGTIKSFRPLQIVPFNLVSIPIWYD